MFVSLCERVQLGLPMLLDVFCSQLLSDTYCLFVNNAIFSLYELTECKLAINSVRFLKKL